MQTALLSSEQIKQSMLHFIQKVVSNFQIIKQGYKDEGDNLWNVYIIFDSETYVSTLVYYCIHSYFFFRSLSL